MDVAALSGSIRCDVLVIGGGGAGIRAALESARWGGDVVLLSQTSPGRSGSTFYPLSPEWGMMYAVDDADADHFYHEILRSCGGCMNPELARKLTSHSLAAFRQLEEEGLRFTTLEALGMVGCFGKKSRGALLLDMEQAVLCMNRALDHAGNLRVEANLYAATLLCRDGVCVGALAVGERGELVAIHAGAVVLACGGPQGLYHHAFSFGALHGAAYAMAGRRGAGLVNLEFMQFINGTVEPVSGLNYYQYTFAEQPAVKNGLGEEFLATYLPPDCTVEQCLTLRAQHGPFSVADNSRYFDLAIVEEYKKGHGIGAWVRPDARRLAQVKYSRWLAFLDKEKIDPRASMRIYPHAHACNGGVLLHSDSSTDIPGLFACGESAGGCHGANRMGGNSILATQVFGRLAGEAAADFARSNPHLPLEAREALAQMQAEMIFESKKGEPAPIVMNKIRDIMQTNAFLSREERGLNDALAQLDGLLVEPPQPGSAAARGSFIARNAIDAARLLISAMLARGESRGGHYRTDYPQTNAGDGEMQVIRLIPRM